MHFIIPLLLLQQIFVFAAAIDDVLDPSDEKYVSEEVKQDLEELKTVPIDNVPSKMMNIVKGKLSKFSKKNKLQ